MPETVTVGGVTLNDATMVEDSGGWQVSDKKTEKGFDYQSYVQREPLEATVEAWVAKDDLAELRDLRDQSKPVKASVGTVSIPKVAVTDVAVTNEASVDSHEEISITLEEQREAEIESAPINIETESGSLGTAASDTQPSTAQSEDGDGGAVEDETGGIVVGTLSSIRETLAGVL